MAYRLCYYTRMPESQNTTASTRSREEEEAARPGERQALWFCAYTPLELLDAAGFRPRRLSGAVERLEEADVLLHPATCPFVRACLVQGMEEIPRGPAVFVNSCDAMRRLHDAWKDMVGRGGGAGGRGGEGGGGAHMMDMPRRPGPWAERRLAQEILRLAEELERDGGLAVTPQSLKEAAALRMEVAKRCLQWGEGLAGSSRMRLAEAAQTLPPRLFLEGPPAGLAEGRGVPLLLTGNLLNPRGLVEVIEEAGGWVKTADLCNGDRPFLDLEEVDGETLEEAALSLARRYLNRRGCARMDDARQREARLLRMARECGARGVIYASLKFCDPYLYEWPRVEALLRSEGLPVLRLDSDYQDGHAGQLSTRVEAFLEMLRQGRRRA